MPDNIIERIPGFSNAEMVRHCELLHRVIGVTYDVKEGKGRNIVLRKEYKHNVPNEIRKKIKNSIEYYNNELNK
jgi:hypothetical protein